MCQEGTPHCSHPSHGNVPDTLSSPMVGYPGVSEPCFGVWRWGCWSGHPALLWVGWGDGAVGAGEVVLEAAQGAEGADGSEWVQRPGVQVVLGLQMLVQMLGVIMV